MVVSSKLQYERNTEVRQPRRKNMTHLWQILKTKSSRAIISGSRRERREFEEKNHEKVTKRWGVFKRNKEMTYKKLSRTLRYDYQEGVVKKISGQRFVYKLSKRPTSYEPDVSSSHQAKLSPLDNNTGSSFSPTTTSVRKSWSQVFVPLSCCPLCLCPRYPSPTTSNGGTGSKIALPWPSGEIIPSATSIPVSVIQSRIAHEETTSFSQ